MKLLRVMQMISFYVCYIKKNELSFIKENESIENFYSTLRSILVQWLKSLEKATEEILIMEMVLEF